MKILSEEPDMRLFEELIKIYKIERYKTLIHKIKERLSLKYSSRKNF